MQDHNTKKHLPRWSTFAKYAVRIAISPTFSVPIVEEQVGANLLQPRVTNEQSPAKNAKLDALFKLVNDRKRIVPSLKPSINKK
jgi:hypothetical protein